MSKPVNKTVIGIFVVVALALVVGAVLIVGSGRFFTNNPTFVMYFQGSVKGLSVGSSVNFRGVKMGTVTDIRMLFNRKDLSIVIPVYVELESGLLREIDMGASTGGYRGKSRNVRFLAEGLILQGLMAQLEMQSIVTGQLQVALDFYPDRPAKATVINPNPFLKRRLTHLEACYCDVQGGELKYLTTFFH